jgi:uncharacterized protein (DUF885 family)
MSSLLRLSLHRWLVAVSVIGALALSSPGTALAASTTRLPAYRPDPNEPAKTADDRKFDALVDEWFAEELVARPSWATNVGVHLSDHKLEGTSAQDRTARLARVRAFLDRARGIEPGHLSPWRRLDQAVLVGRLQSLEQTINAIRPWERDPNSYSSVLSAGIFSLVKREFAPVDVRLRAINSRLAQAPRVFADARANLKNPPKIYTEIAISQGKGLVSFLKDVVPPRVKGATDKAAKAQFERLNAKAIQEVESYVAWMQSDLLPRSTGDFRLGREAYQAKLLYDEGIGTPVDSLLALGYMKLASTHRRMVDVAQRIDSLKSPGEILEDFAKDHPTAEGLLPATREGLDRIRQFIADKHICTAPPNQNLMVAETPIFARSASFASMDSPGVYEQNASEAYYNVTPPDADWPKEKQDDHLGFYNKWQLEVVSIHEAFPGHYYQFLHLKKVPSLVRQLIGPGSNSEGWAHYCEEMAIEEQFGGGDPRYELAMLNLALQRIGRYIVGIEMHVNGWTPEQGTEFFENNCYMARVNAEREARRGTADPTYLVYSLGKWQIQDLREDVKKAWGAQFTLQRFHDRFLELGRLPLPLMREAFLGADYRASSSPSSRSLSP